MKPVSLFPTFYKAFVVSPQKEGSRHSVDNKLTIWQWKKKEEIASKVYNYVFKFDYTYTYLKTKSIRISQQVGYKILDIVSGVQSTNSSLGFVSGVIAADSSLCQEEALDQEQTEEKAIEEDSSVVSCLLKQLGRRNAEPWQVNSISFRQLVEHRLCAASARLLHDHISIVVIDNLHLIVCIQPMRCIQLLCLLCTFAACEVHAPIWQLKPSAAHW